VAISTLQALAVLNAPTPNPFLDRVQMAMVITAQAVTTEATSTALHFQRMQQAVSILNDPVSWRYRFAQDILGQLTLSSTNLVTVAGYTSQDLDTTDATLQTQCSAVFNSFFQH
jgi:hypothetical protein